MGHMLRFSGLLCLKVSQARVPSLASKLVEARRRWCTWHYRRGRIEMELKTDGSMRRAVSDCSTPTLSFSLY
jgi:hypothetical protein